MADAGTTEEKVRYFTKRINQGYPELKINEVDVIDHGQNNDVLVINDALVFRFPKYMKAFQKLRKETSILVFLKNRLPLPIPSPNYYSFERLEAGWVFTGYKKIQGYPLWTKDFCGISDPCTIKELASQLTGFLTELHSLPVEDVKKIISENPISISEEVAGLYERIQQKLYRYMRDDAKNEVTLLFEGFLKDEANLKFEPSLIHGDFGASNILWDAEERKISGIIDFGEACIGDPAYDFAGLLSSYGESFYHTCLSLYPNGDQVSNRVAFYRGTFALQEALHGVENDDKEAFENGMKDYQ